MAQLDATVVNVGLPSVGRSLQASVAGLQWVVNAYVLFLASCAISAGAAGDRFGRRRLFRFGLLIFMAASLGCSLAPTLGVLIAFRAAQGIAASMLMPSTLAIIAAVFTDPRERAAAIGTWAGVSGLATVAGPLLGGVLVAIAGWRSLFWINLPIGALGLVLIHRHVPESQAEHPRGLDPIGQTLLVLALGLFSLALTQAPSRGWGSSSTVTGLVLSLALAVTYAWFETRAREPLFDPRLLRHRALATATAVALLAYASVMGFLFLNSLYLQDRRGLSPLQAGLATLPVTAAMALTAPLSGRLTGRQGARPTAFAGGMLIAAGLGTLSQLERNTALPILLGAYALIGAGWGAVNPAVTTLAISALPNARSGMAAAIAGASRQTGAALGVALVGALVARPLSTTSHTTSTGAMHVTYLIGAGAGLTIALLALRLDRSRPAAR